MKALITSSISDEVLKELKDLMEVSYESWRDTANIYFDSKELVEKLKNYDIFITTADDLKKAAIIEQTDIKLLVSCRGDPFSVNLEAATKKKIPVIYTPLRNVDAVAELTIAYILSLARKLTPLDRFLHSEDFEVIDFEDWIKIYNDFEGIEIKGKVLGIVGFGQIGRRVAERALSFGMKILIFDPFLDESLVEKYGTHVELETLIKESDFISIHAAATEENDNLVSEELIGLMKPSAFIINLAKGSLLDYEALLEALKEKKIAGAALDVFPLEPIDEDNEFLELENVIVTPHMGGNTKEVIERQSKLLLKDIKAWLNKEKITNILNPEVLGYDSDRIPKLNNKFAHLKKEIISTCNKLLEKGHVIGSAGNVSVRVRNEEEEFILITPSNVRYDEMDWKDILMINLEGKVIEGDRNPSVEKHLHLGIYKEREDVDAIIHSHGIFSTILSTLKMSIPPIMEELVPYVGGEIKCAEYGESGTEELALNVVKELEEKNAVLLANHGNICCGSHLDGAYTVLQYVERAAKIYYLAKLIKDPNLLPEDTVDFEVDIFEIFKESKKI